MKKVLSFFTDFAKAITKGDIFVKLSALFMGLGYVRRKKYFQAFVVTLFQIVFIFLFINVSIPNLAKFSTLGTVQQAFEYNPVTMRNEFNDFDNSLLILLFSIISIVMIFVFIYIWMTNIKKAYQLQIMEEEKKHINTFKEDVANALDKDFHKTLLALPLFGICLFTIVPLIVMITIAFTNYDQFHFPPGALFTWVGLENFRTMFTNSLTITFGYSFKKILGWTLTWAFAATFTCYIGGILLALLINNKRTKFKKFWRSGFIVAMAVPQFVSLLLVRQFFADNGIVNTFCQNIGLVTFFKGLGWIPEYMSYIPFLTHPGWAKAMIILINIWVGVPYQLLIATGILMNIPEDQYEAARIDGANPVQQFVYITMPYMLFVTGPSLISSVVSNINNFNVIYLLTKDVYRTTDQALANSNAKETDLLVTWLFTLTNEYYNYKLASVIGILVFVVCAVLTLIAFNTVVKGDSEEAMQ